MTNIHIHLIASYEFVYMLHARAQVVVHVGHAGARGVAAGSAALRRLLALLRARAGAAAPHHALLTCRHHSPVRQLPRYGIYINDIECIILYCLYLLCEVPSKCYIEINNFT